MPVSIGATGEALRAVSGLISSVCGEGGAQEIRPLFTESQQARSSAIMTRHGIDRTFVVKLSAGQDVESAIAGLEASPEVEYAEPNRLV